MQAGIKDLIWDEMALARDLNVSVIKRHDDGAVTHQLSISLYLPADVQRRLEANAAMNRSGFSKRLRHYVKLGLKVCFREEDESSVRPTPHAMV